MNTQTVGHSATHHYREDGWIYMRNLRTGKWFSHVHGVRVWNVDGMSITALEARYHRARLAWDNFIKRQWQPMFDRIRKVGGTVDAKDDKRYVRYVISGDGIATEYPDIRPKRLLHPKIGDEMLRIERRSDTLANRMNKFSTILDYRLNSIIYKWCDRNDLYRFKSLFQVTVNNRVHTFEHQHKTGLRRVSSDSIASIEV